MTPKMARTALLTILAFAALWTLVFNRRLGLSVLPKPHVNKVAAQEKGFCQLDPMGFCNGKCPASYGGITRVPP